MVIMVQGLNPSITGFDGETASEALGGEELIPISFAVGHAILKEEWSIAKQFATMATREALRMEMFANGIQAIALQRKREGNMWINMANDFNTIRVGGMDTYLDFTTALAARGSQVLLETVFTVQITLLFDKANVLQWTTAIGIDTVEVFGTPDLAQSSDEGTSVGMEIKLLDKFLII